MFECHGFCSGDQVVVSVQLEREDDEEVSPFVMAPFFPQVRNGGKAVGRKCGSEKKDRRERERERETYCHCSVVTKAGGR